MSSNVVLTERRGEGHRRKDHQGASSSRQSHSWRESDEHRTRHREDESSNKRRQDSDKWHDSADKRHHSGRQREASGKHADEWLNSEGRQSGKNTSRAEYRHHSDGVGVPGSHRRGSERESGQDQASWRTSTDRNNGGHRRGTDEGSHRRRNDGNDDGNHQRRREAAIGGNYRRRGDATDDDHRRGSDGPSFERGSRRQKEGHSSTGTSGHVRSSGGIHERHKERPPQDKEEHQARRRESESIVGHEPASTRHSDGASRRHNSDQHRTEKPRHGQVPEERQPAGARGARERRASDEHPRVKRSSERDKHRYDSDAVRHGGQSSGISVNRGKSAVDHEAKHEREQDRERRRHVSRSRERNRDGGIFSAALPSRHRRPYGSEHRRHRSDKSKLEAPTVISNRPLHKQGRDDPGGARSNSVQTELEDDPCEAERADAENRGADGDPRLSRGRQTHRPRRDLDAPTDTGPSENSDACASKKRRHRSPERDVRHQALHAEPRSAVSVERVARDDESPPPPNVRLDAGLRSPAGQQMDDDDYSDASHASKELNLKSTEPNEQAPPLEDARCHQRGLISEDDDSIAEESGKEDDNATAKQDPYLQADLSDAQMSEAEDQAPVQARGGVVLPEERREQMRRQLEAAKARAQTGERTQTGTSVTTTEAPTTQTLGAKAQDDFDSYSYSPYSRSLSRSRSPVVLQEAPHVPAPQECQSASRSSSKSASGSPSNSPSRSPSASGSQSCSRSPSPGKPQEKLPQASSHTSPQTSSTQPPPLNGTYHTRPPGMHWTPEGPPSRPPYDHVSRQPWLQYGQGESAGPPLQPSPGWNSTSPHAPVPQPHIQQNTPSWQSQAPTRPYGEWPPNPQPATHNPPLGTWGQAPQTHATHATHPQHPTAHPEHSRPPWDAARPPAPHNYYPPAVAHPFYPPQAPDTLNTKGKDQEKGAGRRRRKPSDGKGNAGAANPPPPPAVSDAGNASLPLDRPPGCF